MGNGKGVRDQMPRKKKLMASSRATMKYMQANTKQMKINLSLKYDADIIAKLETVGNMQGYIKALIRADIENDQG